MRRLILWAIILGVIVFIWGFWNFANTVSQPAQDPPRADAIVALTGGSMERLETGVRLLKQHKGERLLISGVNRLVTDHELFTALHVDQATAQCCVDLGRSAEDTLGNASETAAWARQHHYRRIILVTDDYHMPRSEMELSVAMPEAKKCLNSKVPRGVCRYLRVVVREIVDSCRSSSSASSRKVNGRIASAP